MWAVPMSRLKGSVMFCIGRSEWYRERSEVMRVQLTFEVIATFSTVGDYTAGGRSLFTRFANVSVPSSGCVNDAWPWEDCPLFFPSCPKPPTPIASSPSSHHHCNHSSVSRFQHQQVSSTFQTLLSRHLPIWTRTASLSVLMNVSP